MEGHREPRLSCEGPPEPCLPFHRPLWCPYMAQSTTSTTFSLGCTFLYTCSSLTPKSSLSSLMLAKEKKIPQTQPSPFSPDSTQSDNAWEVGMVSKSPLSPHRTRFFPKSFSRQSIFMMSLSCFRDFWEVIHF